MVRKSKNSCASSPCSLVFKTAYGPAAYGMWLLFIIDFWGETSGRYFSGANGNSDGDDLVWRNSGIHSGGISVDVSDSQRSF